MEKVNGDGIQAVEDSSVESKIKSAMSSRVHHFRDQSDSLTFEGVRRLLEKDLGMQEFSLDSHKRFVKQLLLESLNQSNDSNSMESRRSDVLFNKEEAEEFSLTDNRKFHTRENMSEENEKMEDSPVMGLMQHENSQQKEADKEMNVPTEATVRKALTQRAAYISENSEKITMAGLRRMLEEDLNIKKYSLDPFKQLISKQLDEMINNSQVSHTNKEEEKKGKESIKKVINQHADGLNKDDSPAETEEEEVENEEDEEKEVKKNSRRKRKIVEKETKPPVKRQKKPTGKSSKLDGVENDLEGSHCESSEELSTKKKSLNTPAYGKRVEHLKSVIKSCSMSVPPSIYKKVKQYPENKREAQLIKELEDILSKEGLSANPSEKEIKEVKRRKERTKELEGIDTSNIVSSSRRRSSTSYAAPVIPKTPVVPDDEEEDEDDNNEDDDDENVEGDDEKVEDDEPEVEEDDDDNDDDDNDDDDEEEDNDNDDGDDDSD